MSFWRHNHFNTELCLEIITNKSHQESNIYCIARRNVENQVLKCVWRQMTIVEFVYNLEKLAINYKNIGDQLQKNDAE